jgi:hypothetical protein
LPRSPKALRRFLIVGFGASVIWAEPVHELLIDDSASIVHGAARAKARQNCSGLGLVFVSGGDAIKGDMKRVEFVEDGGDLSREFLIHGAELPTLGTVLIAVFHPVSWFMIITPY